MKKSGWILWYVLFGLCVHTLLYAEVIVFGPKTYFRTQGKPNHYADVFPGISGQARLILYNGGENGDHRVSSARIALNGHKMFGPEDFNPKVDRLETPIWLIEENRVEVELKSSPGSYLTLEIVRNVSAPIVSLSIDPDLVPYGGSAMLTWHSTGADFCVIEPEIGTVSVHGTVSVWPEKTTAYTITAYGPGGTAVDQVLVEVIASSVASQPKGSFGARYEDLIPAGATLTQYDPKRFSLITGLVQGPNSLPITNVSVKILDHSEYGMVSTDDNGRFFLPVEGGSTMTLIYEKDGLIPAHRRVLVPWNDVAVAESVKMISKDPLCSTMTFDGNPDTVYTHHSSMTSDAFGFRSCALVFTGDNAAYEVNADGHVVQRLQNITVRATEFTNPESMPARLPPNSGYTYCVELAVDHVDRVRFDSPVTVWVDNFLGFSVGEPVPAGYYDRDTGLWVSAANGVVVRLLDLDDDGTVDALDADNDGLPDDIDGDGSYRNDVLGLDDSQRYPPGHTFWRVPAAHFTPWDFNWPYRAPEDAVTPNAKSEPEADQQKEHGKDCPLQTGSFVEQRSRIFHEEIAVPGTGLSLHYAGNRVSGYQTVITVPASGDTVPDSLKKIIVRVDIAGKRMEQLLDPLPNRNAVFQWDGMDGLNRRVEGAVTAHIGIGFVYDGVYLSAGEFDSAFAQPGDDDTGISARQEVVLWRHTELLISGKVSVIAEGWTLSAHHTSDTHGKCVLTKGDGTFIVQPGDMIRTVVGDGNWIYGGDGGPAVQAHISDVYGMAVDGPGRLYISDTYNHRIRRVDAAGIITTMAGDGAMGFSGDGGLAVQARLSYPWGIATDVSGNLFIADAQNHRIRRVDAAGIITTVAGSGPVGYGNGFYSGDGGPAVEARLSYPMDVTLDCAGNLYISDNGNNCIRKVDAAGLITTIAGTGISGYSGDGGPAIQARLDDPNGLVVDDTGHLYISDSGNNCVRKVDAAGRITTVAGTGGYGYSGDGSPAIQAQLYYPTGLALDSVGRLYIADAWNHRIRKVDPSGIITTVAGNGDEGYIGDDMPPTRTALWWPAAVAVDPSGNLFIADSWNYRIRSIAFFSASAAVTDTDILFAEENGRGHILTGSGIHRETIDLDTGIPLNSFGYDEHGRLTSVIDSFDNETRIVRNLDGKPVSIVSPDGVTTYLTIDALGHLTQIAHPDGGVYCYEYAPSGLMTAKITPEGHRFEHYFDTSGRLTETMDDAGGHWQFSRTIDEEGDILFETFSGEGNRTAYLDHTDASGDYRSWITDASGDETRYVRSADGLTVGKVLPCGTALDVTYDIDSEYGFVFIREMTQSTPSGLNKTIVRQKTYADTDADDIPDWITQTVTVNNNPVTLENHVRQSENTVTSAEGRTVTWRYDPDTLRIDSLSIPNLHETTFQYDIRGRLTSFATRARQSVFTYNDQGWIDSATDPENYTVYYSYDPVGRVTGIHRPDGGHVAFDYDADGNLTVLTNPMGIEHGFEYNPVNRNSAYDTPLSGSYTYTYDKDRRLIQTGFPSGKQINNIYVNTHLVQVQTPEGPIDITYLCGNKPESISRNGEGIVYGYDGNLLMSEMQSGMLNQTMWYTYNDDFQVTSLTYAGATVDYAYDRDGLLNRAGSFIISRNSQNGLPEVVDNGALMLNRTFNGYGEADAQNFSVSGQSLLSWSSIRNNGGRILQQTQEVSGMSSTHVYEYDSMGRLLRVARDGEVVESYDYDVNGARIYEMNLLRGITARNLIYSDEDHLLTAGSTTYTYDPDGFLFQKTNGDAVTHYHYTSRGELLHVGLPDGRVIEYVHDPLGRRIAKKINGVVVEKYQWQGWTRLLAVYDDMGSMGMRFEYADDRMPLTMKKNGLTYYLACDHVGSLRIVADISGNVVKKIDYDSFGNVIEDSNPSFEVPIGFAGGFSDRDTGLVRFGFRDYDPETGRWTAKDPIFFAGGDTDLYGYCLNDPVNWVDPEGKAGFVGLGVGILSGAYGGYISGIQKGDVKTAIISSIIGGAVGGLFGIVSPNLSSMAGKMIAGVIGGAAGGMTSVYLDNCKSDKFADYADAAVLGGLFGGVTGIFGGIFKTGAEYVGASGVAVDVATAITISPIAYSANWIKSKLTSKLYEERK